ncbi:MAG: flavodoxin family protein [Candidatus Gastranaerophilales bacterium]|nr:flavodoxin family protein [Candidatus Gastranaerophilales bacterium]
MKVLLINSSAKPDGCTFTALGEVAKALNAEGIETEIVQLGAAPVADCVACYVCRKNSTGKCVFDGDIVNILIEKAKEADGFVFGSPVYYAHPTGRILSVMNRVFFAGGHALRYKPAAAVVSARRAGTTAALDVINKHFTINNMPVVPSCYWNMVHGSSPEDVYKDEEGVQIMRTLGKNMAWMLKCIEAGKNADINPPEAEEKIWTNFIR